jgi:hypothetical protein
MRPIRAKRGERGSIAAFVVLFSFCLMALAGLVTEGGAVMSAREQAMTEAEQAARVGAEQASVLGLHNGRILASGSAPTAAAEFVMALYGHRGTATRIGGEVTATVSPFSIRTPLLGLIGLPSIRVSARASAEAVAR